MSTAERLGEFLGRYAETPVTWGVDDCTAVWARWLGECGHRVELPAYGSRNEARAIIERYGGLAATWDTYLPMSVQERIEMPQLGDVAVIDTRLLGEVGVVLAEGGICLWRRERGGFHWLAPRRFVKVWAVL